MPPPDREDDPEPDEQGGDEVDRGDLVDVDQRVVDRQRAHPREVGVLPAAPVVHDRQHRGEGEQEGGGAGDEDHPEHPGSHGARPTTEAELPTQLAGEQHGEQREREQGEAEQA